MTSHANILMADSQVKDVKHGRCIIQDAMRLRAKVDIMCEHMSRRTVSYEDVAEWFRLFGEEFDDLISEAGELADEYQEKAELYDNNEDDIDNWKRIYDETSATCVDDVLEAFAAKDKLGYIAAEISEYV